MRLKQLPREGDERTRIKFAWLPIDCDDGTRRWLERVTVRERFYDGWGQNAWLVTSTVPWSANR